MKTDSAGTVIVIVLNLNPNEKRSSDVIRINFVTSAVRKITNSNPKYCLAQQSLFQLCKNYSANCPSTIVNYFNLQVGRNFLRRSEIRMRSSYQQFKQKKNRNYGNGDKLKFFVFRA